MQITQMKYFLNRDAEVSKVPFMLIVGEKEAAERTVSVRRKGEGDLGTLSIDDFTSYFSKEIKNNLSSF